MELLCNMGNSLTLTVGIPGSGKTTWAEKVCCQFDHIVNINRDDIREELFGFPYTYKKEREESVTALQLKRAVDAVDACKDIIISDTNLEQKTRDFWANFAKEHGYDLIIKEFCVNPNVALRQNRQRERSVPEFVIHDMFDKWLIYKGYEKYVPNDQLQKCVIFDIDGTLAHMIGRSPFDWSMVGSDVVDKHVQHLLWMYHDARFKIVVVSGRDGVCREQTKQWLKANNIPFDELFMRKEGDSRPDFQVKHEILLTNVAPKYNVHLCVDDRDQVVRMWRWHGIKCFQVQEGRF